MEHSLGKETGSLLDKKLNTIQQCACAAARTELAKHSQWFEESDYSLLVITVKAAFQIVCSFLSLRIQKKY